MQGTKPTSSDLHCAFFFDTLEFIRQNRPYLDERQKIISDTISMLSYLQAGDDREESVERKKEREREKPAENQYHF